jgi:regulator of protease activity HflC (stomatin/prohibitin superfamily)
VLAAGGFSDRALVAMAIASAAGFGVFVRLLGTHTPSSNPAAWWTAIGIGLAFAAAGIAALAARYLAAADPQRLPESPGLARGARVLAWIYSVSGLAVGLAWAGYAKSVSALDGLVLIVLGGIGYQLFQAGRQVRADATVFPTELGVFSLLGSRANPLASVLDTARRQLGIDLRSTWALTVVRRSAEPLLVACAAIGWLSTALTVVGPEEQGLVERLGVPMAPALPSGVHLHWPWPIDRVMCVAVLRVQTLPVGHEGEVESGPEDVLWARQHGGTEYTLLLGDGRDLIAVDAAVHFRISDAHAWIYGSQNPSDALRAIAYRAVMQATVGRTLAEALSENVTALTAKMRAGVQADADALGLGIEVVSFTVGGMHPPVRIARNYQAVVSAELARTTAVVEAQAYRNQIVPAAEADVVARSNAARAEAAEALGKAAGEAWSFRTLESEYRAAPQEYRFRRRLETLEKGLGGRRFTVLDARVQRDGGELWLMK